MTDEKWITYAFNMAGVTDWTKMIGGVNGILSGVSPEGTFAGDNLVTFGKNLSFLNAPEFLEAFKANEPDSHEAGLIWRTYVLYWAARHGLTLPGDFVEAGCYKGTSAKIIADAVGIETTDRTYWLYDAFDHPEGSNLRLRYHSPDLHAQVVARFAGYQRVRIIKGHVPDSFADGMPAAPIAFLHIDMNNAEPEIATLDAMYDRVSPGGVIVLDDYGYAAFRGQRDAHDAWFAKRGKMVLELPTSQGIVIR